LIRNKDHSTFLRMSSNSNLKAKPLNVYTSQATDSYKLLSQYYGSLLQTPSRETNSGLARSLIIENRTPSATKSMQTTTKPSRLHDKAAVILPIVSMTNMTQPYNTS
jgi:hypothetical protein